MNTSRLSTASTCAALLLASGAATCAALADTSNLARVVVTPNAAGDWPTDNSEQHVGLCDTAATGVGGFNSSGSGAASATYGLISLSGSAGGSLTTFLSGVSRDELTISAPGIPTGTPGTLTFTVDVHGELGASAGGSVANWQLTAGLGEGGYAIDRSAQRFGPATPWPGYWGDAFGTYSGTANFQFGVTTPLYFGLVANARAAYSDASTAGSATVGSPLTVRWMGISAVTAGGAPVANYTIASASRTNYHGIATPPAPCAADLGSAGGMPGADGSLDSNDFIVFISCFFDQTASADLGRAGGLAGSDGLFDNNDFIVFITRFFSGC